MEISWVVVFVVFILNLACMGAMYLAQVMDPNLPPRHSTIPGTNQRFIYVQDFWTMTWGDGLGVSLITSGFMHLVVNGRIDLWQWPAFVALAIVSASIFANMCLGKEHKPDMCFPDIGKISWICIVHLPYFGVAIAISIFSICHLFTGQLRGPAMWVGLSGGAVYITCFILEIRSGNFDPLKRVS